MNFTNQGTKEAYCYQTRKSRVRNRKWNQESCDRVVSTEQIFVGHISQWERNLQNMILQLDSVAKRVRNQKNNDKIMQRYRIIIRKIQLEKEKYFHTISKIKTKLMTNGALISLNHYLRRSYTDIKKQALEFISILKKQNSFGELGSHKLQSFEIIRNCKKEIDAQWESLKVKNEQSINSVSNTFMDGIYKSNLAKTTMEQLHKQFLAIRMISYKMYQDHTGHNHQNLIEQLSSTKQQQQRLMTQIASLKNMKQQLKSEQKKISYQLAEIKKMNQFIGRRYFVQKSRIQTNLTTT